MFNQGRQIADQGDRMNSLVGPIEKRVVDLEDHFEDFLASSAAEPYLADGPHLRDLWRSVRNHPVLVIGLTFLITAAVGVFLALRPDLYETEAQVQVDLESGDPQLRSNKTSSFIVNPVNDPAYFNTQLQLLTSPSLLRRVIKTLDIEHNPAFAAPPPSQMNLLLTSVLTKLGLKDSPKNPAQYDFSQEATGKGGMTPEELAEVTRLEPYVQAIQSSLTVEPVKETRLPIKETRLINIGFSHRDRQIAAKVVNTIADTFVSSNLEKKTEQNTTTGDILQRRITELQAQIRSAEERLFNYAKDHEILSLDPSQNTVVERLAGLNRQLLDAENDRKLAEAAYRAALAPGAADALAEATAVETVAIANRLAELSQRRAQVLVEATEEWPEVKELDQQIAEVEKQLRKTRERATTITVTNRETKYREALAREEALRTAFNRQRDDTVKQNEAAIYYRIMQQEVDTNKNLLDGVLQRRQEVDGLLAGMTNNIRVNDYAIVPQVPIGPSRLLYTGVVFALSLAFSIGLAVLTDYMDDSVRSREDVEKTLHARTLALIPAVKGVMSSPLLKLTTALRKRNGSVRDQSELLLDGDAQSGLNQLYRQLRTSILLSNPEGALQTILVTASMPSEGKTTAAINTAVSLARTRANVLLIDADTRNPTIPRIFGFDNHDGLSTILSSGKERAEVLSMIKRHEASGLFVLTSGPAEPNFTEFLGSERMRRLMTELRSDFHYIIVDSPPVAHFADGALISQMVDGVLLVVNSGKTSRDLVRQSQQVLQDVGANIVGVVLNNVKTLPHDYRYYRRYYAKSTNCKPVNGKGVDQQG